MNREKRGVNGLKKGLALLLMLLMVTLAGGGAVCLAAEESTAVEEDAAAANTFTLEEAKALVLANSRSVEQKGISVDKAQYKVEQTEEDQDESLDEYNSLGRRYEALMQDYEDASAAGDAAKMAELQEQMDALDEQMEARYDSIDALSDSVESAEDSYDDAVDAEEDFRKELAYTVDEIFTSIISQEQSRQILNKEYALKQQLLDLEKKKLVLGRTSRSEVERLNAEVCILNKGILQAAAALKADKGRLNDMMGRDYDQELHLTPFEVPTTVEVPEAAALLAGALRHYDPIDQLERDIEDSEDELDDEDGYYARQLIRLDIDEQELLLEDEKISVTEKINNLITDVQGKLASYELAKISLETARRVYEWDQKRYDLGLISKNALLESELDCLDKQAGEASAGYALFLARHALQLAGEGVIV